MSVVLVTGASRGIGRAIVARFVREGQQVIACARGRQGLDELKSKHPAVECFPCDLRAPEAVDALAQTVLDRHGAVDLLVNNAGAFRPGGIASEDDEVLLDMLRSNLFGAYRLTRRLLPTMQARRSGMVLNVCSTASIAAYPNGGSYSIAKHALYGFSRNLREEMKSHGIRVVALLPGATLTDSWKDVPLPSERLMPAEDVAEMAWTAWAMSPRTVVEDILMRPQRGDIGEADFQ
ncbi:MAG: SDR family oxidoreductase [Thermomonas sp.]|uniref:SDR family oxidoreductase n=1 Tax=Thermomonas sp. TaxID=1971895 RepID=UPI002633D2A7|nr:SDR family oxidoreductase [Thermomonas sp.]MCC7097121.1 SDR family oxidoreductase [Thermomonas sp.]